jgi:nucleoid-associated protein YgaU
MFLKIALVAGIALLVWSAAARPSGAHARKQVYRVKAYDTLWTIASKHYGGDTSDAVWRIEHTNDLGSTTISPGELLVLP